jgi:hypothetical protein
LFETIEMLKDPEADMDINKAKAIADIGRVLVDSAKVEVEFQKHVGGGPGSGFIDDGTKQVDIKPALRIAGSEGR